MKKQFAFIRLILPAWLILTMQDSQAQVTFELTTSRTNTVASRALIDIPELTDNPTAIIVATLDDNQRMSNPHPMGAWYYGGKWNLFNTDHAPLPIGLKFKITYYLKPDVDQFVHNVSVIEREGSYINNTTLNNNPNAKFDFLQIHGTKANGLNPYEAEIFYSTLVEKWGIRNKGGRELSINASYNIVVTSGRSSASYKAVEVPELIVRPTISDGPKSLALNGSAGGDLTGTYPDPTVQRLLGRPLSNIQPTSGQVLKWNGSEWAAGNDEVGTPSNSTTGWLLNGNNLNNTNTGNVGVGNNNPAYQLDVNNRMRIRSGGNNTVSAGLWLNNNANAETAFIGMEDDTHVGLFGKTSGWKFGMNTETGALKVNGTEGKAGQVLASNGASGAAGYTTIGNLINANFKVSKASIQVPFIGIEHHLSDLTHKITLTRKSRLIISVNTLFQQLICIGCNAVGGKLILKVNGNWVTDIPYSVAPSSVSNFSICNFMVDLIAGIHSIDFYVACQSGPIHIVYPKYSSVIILPVD